MFSKLILLATLYTSQFIPTTFFIQALPVFMRQQKMSLNVIGFLGLLILPPGLKFLWSPLIDRYRLGKLGHYRGWIICFQLLLTLTMFTTAFLDIQNNLNVLLICMFLASLFSSSQDIATDALAVNILEPQERGLGNAIQSGGNVFGAVLGGGVMLILLEKMGWRYSLITMSMFMLINLIPILLYQEEVTIKPQKSGFFRSYFQPFMSFFSRPNTLPWLFILLLYMTGESVTSILIRPLLVDRGLSLSDIGWILGIVSYSARIFSALIAGLLIVKIGQKKSLVLFGIIAAFTTLLYIIPAIGVSSLVVLYAVCILVNITQSMAYTALLSVMMSKSDRATAATDYTIQVSVMFLGAIAATVLSGMLATTKGYTFTFITSAAVSLLSVFLITKKSGVSS
ncbi:MFS transporter [Nostoc sphaeroides]|uniref:Integral membrane signal transducer protein n=1 Tax=Nostoc sphaeroides CCNUC1 TaxID=2653204 RepID=A0A5P8WIQ2_9NOSO|nr:MFS transporter [Nostoc sphaeroides]QFS52460.1 integral membrane signal transducer protein [Nostoc sphaeroides CCNUC1]